MFQNDAHALRESLQDIIDAKGGQIQALVRGHHHPAYPGQDEHKIYKVAFEDLEGNDLPLPRHLDDLRLLMIREFFDNLPDGFTAGQYILAHSFYSMGYESGEMEGHESGMESERYNRGIFGD